MCLIIMPQIIIPMQSPGKYCILCVQYNFIAHLPGKHPNIMSHYTIYNNTFRFSLQVIFILKQCFVHWHTYGLGCRCLLRVGGTKKKFIPLQGKLQTFFKFRTFLLLVIFWTGTFESKKSCHWFYIQTLKQFFDLTLPPSVPGNVPKIIRLFSDASSYNKKFLPNSAKGMFFHFFSTWLAFTPF